jgi:hypothetical protein
VVFPSSPLSFRFKPLVTNSDEQSNLYDAVYIWLSASAFSHYNINTPRIQEAVSVYDIYRQCIN